MRLRLAPLVQVTTGQIHSAFPKNVLAYWCLTNDQLDSLANFYHQRESSRWKNEYPCPVPWPPGMTIQQKRR